MCLISLVLVNDNKPALKTITTSEYSHMDFYYLCYFYIRNVCVYIFFFVIIVHNCYYCSFRFKHNKPAHCRFVSWQLEFWKWHWNQPVRLKRCIFTHILTYLCATCIISVAFILKMQHTKLNYHWKEMFLLLSGRSSDQCERKKDRQKQNGSVLWWQISSVFFALMLTQSERIHVCLSAAPTLAPSHLCFLPSFFSSSLSLSVLNVY